MKGLHLCFTERIKSWCTECGKNKMITVADGLCDKCKFKLSKQENLKATRELFEPLGLTISDNGKCRFKNWMGIDTEGNYSDFATKEQLEQPGGSVIL